MPLLTEAQRNSCPEKSTLAGETPLHKPAVGVNLELMQTLISAGEDAILKTSRGETPFALAILVCRPPEIVEALKQEWMQK